MSMGDLAITLQDMEANDETENGEPQIQSDGSFPEVQSDGAD